MAKGVLLNNVLFYSPTALIVAIAKWGNSASYFEFSREALPVKNQQRSFPSLSAEILKAVGAKHNVLEPAGIEKALVNLDSNKWLIEVNIFRLLTNINFKKHQVIIPALHFGAYA